MSKYECEVTVRWSVDIEAEDEDMAKELAFTQFWVDAPFVTSPEYNVDVEQYDGQADG